MTNRHLQYTELYAFSGGGNSDLYACLQGYGSDGLKLISHEESISFGESVLKLTFDPGTVEDGLLTVECRLDHPFYVKNKGMQSYKYTWVYITTFLESSCRFYYCPMLLEKSIKSNVVESIYCLYKEKKKTEFEQTKTTEILYISSGKICSSIQVECRKTDKLGGERKAANKGGFSLQLNIELLTIKVPRF